MTAPFLLAALIAASTAGTPPAGDDPLFSPAGIPSGFSLPARLQDPKIPPPPLALGHRIGEAYTDPDEIVRYVRLLAGASPRVRIEEYGRTPEGRELLLAFVSSERNLSRLGELREGLAALADPATPAATAAAMAASLPAVAWIGCSVHGDEPAGSEAGLALLWYLAASREDEVARLLDQLVVVVDPDANPDGKARHVAWWRSVAGREPDGAPTSIENNPPWPDGRSNHAGVDLNRDWALGTQPETRARIAAFLRTSPQLFVDLHEMGSESTYFFPPSADPIHPHMPAETARWFELFGRANARAFDGRGWSYFVREVFDVFYPGYGDSWPSFHGAVGMTYEVAGSPGLEYRRKDGTVLTLKERALKHFTAVRATLETAATRRKELLESFSRFFREAARDGKKIFLVPSGQDPTRLRRLADVLSLQGVRVERTTRDVEAIAPGHGRLPAGSLVVDSAQPLGRFAEALLEREAVLPDRFIKEERARLLREEPDRFYDVTAWSLPIAWGLDSFHTLDRAKLASCREPWTEPAKRALEAGLAGYGWLFPSDDFASRLAAGKLLSRGVKVLATSFEIRAAGTLFPPGSFLIRRENNGRDVAARVAEAAGEAAAVPVPLASAWTEAGPSLGSNSLLPLREPSVVLLTGDGASPGSAASLAEAVERDLGIRVSRRRVGTLAEGLRGVTAILLPHASEPFRRELLREENAAALRRFVEGGGIVIGVRGGAEALREKPLSLSEIKAWEAPKSEQKADQKADQKAEAKSEQKAEPKVPAKAAAAPPPGAEDQDLVKDLDRRALGLPGAALRARSLPSHPLLWGLGRTPAFLVSDSHPPRRLPEAKANVVSVAPSDPLLSGFAWREALDRWSGAPLVQVEEVGKGKVVSFAADPVFRGTWLGTEVLLLNAVLLLPSAER